jgi:localization factor PodJL
MSSAGPWSVKGIDPKAREIAKDLARRSGMTLGEWLNQMIIDGEPEAPPMAHESEPRRYEPQRPIMQAPRGRYEAEYERAPTDGELTRITRALEAFSSRLEAAEHRSTLAISGIDQSVMGVLSRMDGIERDQTSVAARYEGSLDEVRVTQSKLADQLRRIEQEDGPRVEAMKALEAALGKVAAQIYEGESRTRGALSEVRQDLSGLARRVDRLDVEVAGKADAGDPYSLTSMVESVSKVAERLEQAESRTSAAVQSLESSFAGLDARLKSAENRLEPVVDEDSPEHRFQRLANDLQEKVEASRAEMAEHMRAAADGKLDRMEAALRELSGHVESAEKQSAQAIDRMGREVMRIAQTLGQRVAVVETRNAEAEQRVGGEMARIADSIENRMRSADSAQAEALEKLGGEIGRIAERLAERISASERRAATAIDEVGDQVARVNDKINQRHDRAASELSDRIRQSEERTAKLLEDARETLDRRLIDAQRRNAIEAAVQAVETPAGGGAGFGDTGYGGGEPFPQGDLGPAAGPAFNDDPFDPPPEAARFDQPARFDAPRFDEADEPAGFAEPADAPYSPTAAEIFEDFAPPPIQPGRNSTRDLIEAARAAARQAAAADGRGRRGRPADDFAPGAPAPALDPEAVPRGLGAFLTKRKKKRESNTLKTALLASGTAAVLTMSAMGWSLISASHSNDSRGGGEPPATPNTAASPEAAAVQTSDADLLAAALTPEPPAVDSPAASAASAAGSAVPAKPAPATAPAPAPAPVKTPAMTKPAQTAAAAAAPGPTADPKQMFSSAVRQIEGGDATGIEPLRRAANLGYAPAQFYLAKLHETGTGGAKKDPNEARRWTERAAAGGDVKAMHNLGLYYFEGTGGPKNLPQAAAWFRRAADGGLKDSQYNLARLYEQGYGVTANPAEAYKWYLIAAAGGDGEAKSSAERVRQQLTPATKTAAESSAAAFRAQTTSFAAR